MDHVLHSGNRALHRSFPSSLVRREAQQQHQDSACLLSACVRARIDPLFPLPSLNSFLFSNFIHKMQQHHTTIFTLASCCWATAAQKGGELSAHPFYLLVEGTNSSIYPSVTFVCFSHVYTDKQDSEWLEREVG